MEKKYIGKYVCYDRADGGACWGRIKDEGIVSKREEVNGKWRHVEKEVFILENRYVRYWRTADLKNYRNYYPGASVGDLSLSKPMSLDENDRPFLEVKKVRGDSTLHKEQIDLERDIVDFSDILQVVDDETLFKAMLNNKSCDAVTGRNAREIGLQALLNDKELSDDVIKELQSRVGNFDIENKGEEQ